MTETIQQELLLKIQTSYKKTLYMFLNFNFLG